MQYEVEVGGRLRHVRVHREGGVFIVDVDGRRWAVEATRIDAQRLSLLIASADADGALSADSLDAIGARARDSVEVAVTPNGSSGQLAVHVGGSTVATSLNGRRWRRRDDHSDPGDGPQRIVAPMPGKVLRLLVQQGQTVAARHPVVVVEAMKMENELRTASAGVVSQVAVREGQSVEAGALLVVITPDAS